MPIDIHLFQVYNKLNKTKTTQTKQRKEVKRMRTELMKDVKEFIKFNDLIHKDYDEVINEFSDENLTDEEADRLALMFEIAPRLADAYRLKNEETDEVKNECLRRVKALTDKVTMYADIDYLKEE